MPTYLLFLHEDPSVFARFSPKKCKHNSKVLQRKQRRLNGRSAHRGEKLQDGTVGFWGGAGVETQLPMVLTPKARSY